MTKHVKGVLMMLPFGLFVSTCIFAIVLNVPEARLPLAVILVTIAMLVSIILFVVGITEYLGKA